MRRYASSGDERILAIAADAYVAALGGSARAAGDAVAARRVGEALGKFLLDVAQDGLARALDNLGLGGPEGQDLRAIASALADLLAGAGSTREEAVARQALAEVLARLFGEMSKGSAQLPPLDRLDPAGIAPILETLIAEYVYQRMLEELGLRIEIGAPTPQRVLVLEKQIRAFTKDKIDLEKMWMGVPRLDWGGPQGEALFLEMLAQAYELLKKSEVESPLSRPDVAQAVTHHFVLGATCPELESAREAIREHVAPGDMVVPIGFAGAKDAARIDTNIAAQLSVLGAYPDPVATEFFGLAALAYVADKHVPRKTARDRWTREFGLHFSSPRAELWGSCVEGLQEALGFLTGDRWRIFVRDGAPSVPDLSIGPVVPKTQAADCVTLFSGGLDSLVGALDLLAANRTLLLVGHYADSFTPGYQEAAHGRLVATYGEERCRLFRIRVRPRSLPSREPTTRGRSFLFLATAVLLASAIEPKTEVWVPENGFISLNVPLSSSRLGSLSTRTTHPHFLALMRRVMATLGLKHPILVPYRFRTKGEMLTECGDQATLKEAIETTMSCAHPAAGRFARHPPRHCGSCLPCLVRRAALLQAAMLPDVYTDEALHDLEPSRRGATARGFAIAVESLKEREASTEVLRAGPLSGSLSGEYPPAGPLFGTQSGEDLRQYAHVHARGLAEVSALLASGDLQP
jgi:hypothetical protein